MFGKIRSVYFPPADLLDEALQHVGRAESPAVLLRQSEHGGRLVEAVLKCPKGRGSLLFQLLSEVVKSGSSLFLRRGFQNLVEHLVHLISVIGGRLVQDIPPEVRLTPLPDKTREGLLQGLPQVPYGHRW
jgi:hypothetical protein